MRHVHFHHCPSDGGPSDAFIPLWLQDGNRSPNDVPTYGGVGLSTLPPLSWAVQQGASTLPGVPPVPIAGVPPLPIGGVPSLPWQRLQPSPTGNVLAHARPLDRPLVSPSYDVDDLLARSVSLPLTR